MKALKAKLLVVLIGVLLLMGCSARFRDSGIPWAFGNDQLIHKVGASQGIFVASSDRRSGAGAHSVFVERQFCITVTSGTAQKLLEAFQSVVRQEIESRAAKIRVSGKGLAGEEDVRSFSYEYAWDRNEGFVRVYSVCGTNGQIRIFLLCYEHRK
jgi:uncharacterized lipoprotein YajG